jgi:hypothetical protein
MRILLTAIPAAPANPEKVSAQYIYNLKVTIKEYF